LTPRVVRPTIAAMSRPRPKFEITPDILLRAYSIGLFPMAESRESESLFWVEPEARGVFPLDGLKVSRSLAKIVRSDVFEVVADRDFAAVMRGCAARDKTWINAEILRVYGELYARGHAHSVEVYQRGALIGGLYGVSLGAAFFGESMFHLARDASKVALVHLVARLKRAGFRLLDAQFVTPHLAGLGAVEISREDYRERLAAAIDEPAEFRAFPADEAMSGGQALALALSPSDGTNIASL
jgi:leucyl/phenylalanyl-tRNA--protein transferase